MTTYSTLPTRPADQVLTIWHLTDAERFITTDEVTGKRYQIVKMIVDEDGDIEYNGRVAYANGTFGSSGTWTVYPSCAVNA